jgi:hypothetical protein
MLNHKVGTQFARNVVGMKSLVIIGIVVILSACGSDSSNASANTWSQSGREILASGCIDYIAANYPSAVNTPAELTYCVCAGKWVVNAWSESDFFSAGWMTPERQSEFDSASATCKTSAGL